MNRVKEINDSGRYFLLFAQCQSMLEIFNVEGEFNSIVYKVDNEDVALSIDFEFDSQLNEGSRLNNFFSR